MITSRSLNFLEIICVRISLYVVFRSAELLKRWRQYTVYLMLSLTVREDGKVQTYNLDIQSDFYCIPIIM